MESEAAPATNTRSKINQLCMDGETVATTVSAAMFDSREFVVEAI